MDRTFALTLAAVILIILTAVSWLALIEARKRELMAPGRILMFYVIAVAVVLMAAYFFLSLHPPPLTIDLNKPWEIPPAAR